MCGRSSGRVEGGDDVAGALPRLGRRVGGAAAARNELVADGARPASASSESAAGRRRPAPPPPCCEAGSRDRRRRRCRGGTNVARSGTTAFHCPCERKASVWDAAISRISDAKLRSVAAKRSITSCHRAAARLGRAAEIRVVGAASGHLGEGIVDEVHGHAAIERAALRERLGGFGGARHHRAADGGGQHGGRPARVDRAALEIRRAEAPDRIVGLEHHAEGIELPVAAGAPGHARAVLGFLELAVAGEAGDRGGHRRIGSTCPVSASMTGETAGSLRTPRSRSRRARGRPASRRSSARRRAGTSRASAGPSDRPAARPGRSRRRPPGPARRRRRSGSRSRRWSRSAATSGGRRAVPTRARFFMNSSPS